MEMKCSLFILDKGKVETMFGTITYRKGDYVVIPIGTIYRVLPEEDTKMLIVESFSQITTPRRYRNEYGQLLEHSPFCERDLRGPESLQTSDEEGEFEVITKSRGSLHSHVLNHHPLDVVGWDGYLYPWVFNIEDFEPITGRVHQPPPVHQTFEGHNFVVCSFVPRLYDYHPESIPAPYNHSNVNSDEVAVLCGRELYESKRDQGRIHHTSPERDSPWPSSRDNGSKHWKERNLGACCHD